MIKKWTEDGFRNPRYDVWETRIAVTALALACVGAVWLVAAG